LWALFRICSIVRAVFTGRVLFSMTILEDWEILQDLTGRGLPELQVSGHAGAGAEGLGGSVDADENDVVVPDAGGDIRG